MKSGIVEFYNNFLPKLKRDHSVLRNNPRHEIVKASLSFMIKKGLDVLDIGCGTGITSRFIAEQGAMVTAVDIAPKLIEFAKENSAHENIDYVVADATSLRLNKVFDRIVLVDVLEHIPIEELVRLMNVINIHAKRDAIVYLNVPDGRFQAFMKENYPEKQQIIDNTYKIQDVLWRFNDYGFEAFYFRMYGIDVSIQYNEYMFCRPEALKNEYEARLKQIYRY